MGHLPTITFGLALAIAALALCPLASANPFPTTCAGIVPTTHTPGAGACLHNDAPEHPNNDICVTVYVGTTSLTPVCLPY
jgi:hypothetical protein